MLLSANAVEPNMKAVLMTLSIFHDFQASYLTKTVALGMKRVDLAIWDTAGQEMFHALGPLYYRLVVFKYSGSSEIWRH